MKPAVDDFAARNNRKINMKTFRKYAIMVFVVLATVLGTAWYYASREQFIRVSLICYGFLVGYLAAWFHIGRRLEFRKFGNDSF